MRKPAAILLACLVLGASPARAQDVDPADIAFWDAIKHSRNPAEYEAYLQAFPAGKFAPLARLRVGNRPKDGKEGAATPAAPDQPRGATIRPLGPVQNLPRGQAAAPAMPPGRIDAFALSREAFASKRAGMFAKYRGKTLEIQGRFQRFNDTTIGESVNFEFVLPQGFDNPQGFKIRCAFPRRDTRAFDTMGNMKIGTNVVVRGQIFDVLDSYQWVTLQPCAIIDPPLHASDNVAAQEPPKRPPFGSYLCVTSAGMVLNPPIRLVDDESFVGTDGKRGRYTYDAQSGRIEFQGSSTFGIPSYGIYNFPGAPISGGTSMQPEITLTPVSGGSGTISCPLTR